LVADLTHNNLGAYWEAGFAEGLGKPVFYTCEKGCFDSKGTHFDVRQHYTVVWEEGKFEEAAEKLKTEIQNTLPTEAKMD
jgi:nucleoside 2-deoxyribosyltransferase